MNDIKSVCDKLVQQHGTNDPFELCARLNIKLIIDKMPLSISGFYSNAMGIGFIYLNRELDEIQRKVICAHELGHALLHPCANSLFLSRKTLVVSSKLERQADLFAAHLLISDRVFEQLYDEPVTLGALAAQLNLPLSMLELKFEEQPVSKRR